VISFSEIPLKNALKFYNGKAIDAQLTGDFPVYGSNGIIGYSNKHLFEDGIVIGRVGAYCGAIVYEKGKFWASDNTIVVNAKLGYDNKYLAFLLEVIDLNWFSGGSAQPLITHGWIKPIKAKIPDYAAQQKIAGILSAYDNLVENNLQRIKLLEEMAQITYEEWFVRMQFPGHENTPIVPETGLPEGWSKGRLEKMFELQRGFDLPVQDRVQGTIPILASTGVIGTHSIHKVKGPGVVTGRSGTIGEVKYTQSNFWPLNTSLWIKKFHRGGSIFAYHFLKGFHLERLGGGSAVPSLDRKVVHAQMVHIPPVSLVNEFEKEIGPIFSILENLTSQNESLKEARDILLPRLMTGMIDVERIELPEILLARIQAAESSPDLVREGVTDGI